MEQLSVIVAGPFPRATGDHPGDSVVVEHRRCLRASKYVSIDINMPYHERLVNIDF
jgi:hypothetical protein